MEAVFLTAAEVQQILDRQRLFFSQGGTLGLDYRAQQLKKLREAVLEYGERLDQALKADLGKSGFESYTTERGFLLAEISHALKHLKGWMKPSKKASPLHVFPAKSWVEKQPYGSVLIIGPYNYPVQLLLAPLIGAIAAGNCAVLSPSELVPTVSAVIKEMIENTFAPSYICCVEGGVENNTVLLNARFDYIFFTGSVPVGKIVMREAAKNLIPVTLELGGKSPVIVDKSAKISMACERIVWGKLMNAGQTCVAPDYVFVQEAVCDAFLKELVQAIHRFYGTEIRSNPDYGRIVNKRHMQRLKRILQQDREKIVFGGGMEEEERFLEPTILHLDSLEAACMREELFGPLLPVISYQGLGEALDYISGQEKPLALYIFAEDQSVVRQVLKRISSGGACINDTISHIINPNLPFGGVGYSGMGSYHGEYSFLTFSHQRAVLCRSTKLKVTFSFPPFTAAHLQKVKRFFH